MPFRYTMLSDIEGEWQGRVARISRLVSKPWTGAALLREVALAVEHVTQLEEVFVGAHHADDGRSVVMLLSVWESPATLRNSVRPDVPLGYEGYSELVESWTMEYFEEHLEVRRGS